MASSLRTFAHHVGRPSAAALTVGDVSATGSALPPSRRPSLPRERPYAVVDVFTPTAFRGNPVAVCLDARDLADEQLATFTRWTNLSECAFLLPPTPRGAAAGADYRVRIFAPDGELSFAGHPTLGACHAWLAAGGRPKSSSRVVQECGIGHVLIRRENDRLAFAAPALLEDAPIPDDELGPIAEAFGLAPEEIVDHRVLDNGPGWRVLLLDSAARVLDAVPDLDGLHMARPDLSVGLVGPHPATQRSATAQRSATRSAPEPALEVRGFALAMGVPEDPVTGSLHAVVGQWLIRTGRVPPAYVATQGEILGRSGTIHVAKADGEVWVGGNSVICVSGTVLL